MNFATERGGRGRDSISENGLVSNFTQAGSISINEDKIKIVMMTAKLGFDKKFRTVVETYCKEVRQTEVFHHRVHDLFCYEEPPDFEMQNKKFSRHRRFLTEPTDKSARGGGYWFHKPLILQHHMDQYNDGDYLIWTDVDRIDFVQQNTSFIAVLETMVKRGDDLCIESMMWSLEKDWTKQDILAAFKANSGQRDSPQVNANAIVMRISSRMKTFINTWVECVSDWHMVSDEQSILPNAGNFKENRHDQSILSLLIKTFMSRQGVIGPPARTYKPGSQYYTYKLLESVDPVCPLNHFIRLHTLRISTRLLESLHEINELELVVNRYK